MADSKTWTVHLYDLKQIKSSGITYFPTRRGTDSQRKEISKFYSIFGKTAVDECTNPIVTNNIYLFFFLQFVTQNCFEK